MNPKQFKQLATKLSLKHFFIFHQQKSLLKFSLIITFLISSNPSIEMMVKNVLRKLRPSASNFSTIKPFKLNKTQQNEEQNREKKESNNKKLKMYDMYMRKLNKRSSCVAFVRTREDRKEREVGNEQVCG
jgi:hypothetical protein